jgi:tetratricopeptide (TPR) repeat protein
MTLAVALSLDLASGLTRAQDAQACAPAAAAFDAGDTQKAIDSLSQCLTDESLSAPARATLLQDRANAHAEIGNFTQSLSDFDEAITLRTANAEAHNDRGLTYYAMGDIDRAINDYAQAIAIDPKFMWPFYNRALAHLAVGQPDDAIVDFTKAIELDAQDPDPVYQRGLIFQSLGQYDAAIADFSRVIELAPDDNPAFTARANAHADSGAYDNAVDDFAKAIALDPQDPHATNNAAWFFATTPSDAHRNGAKAIDLAKKSLSILGDDAAPGDIAEFHDTLAAAYAEAGDFAKAVAEQETAIALLGQDASSTALEIFQARLALYKANKTFQSD